MNLFGSSKSTPSETTVDEVEDFRDFLIRELHDFETIVNDLKEKKEIQCQFGCDYETFKTLSEHPHSMMDETSLYSTEDMVEYFNEGFENICISIYIQDVETVGDIHLSAKRLYITGEYTDEIIQRYFEYVNNRSYVWEDFHLADDGEEKYLSIIL